MKGITPERLASKMIAKHDLVKRTRKHEILRMRQYVMYMLAKKSYMSLSEIGSFFDQDHATVINARKVIQDALDTRDRVTLEQIEPVKSEFDKYDFPDVDRYKNDNKIAYVHLTTSEYELLQSTAKGEGVSVSMLCKLRVLDDDADRIKRKIERLRSEADELEKMIENV